MGLRGPIDILTARSEGPSQDGSGTGLDRSGTGSDRIGPGTGPIRSDPVRSGLRPVWTGLTILGSSIGGGPL